MIPLKLFMNVLSSSIKPRFLMILLRPFSSALSSTSAMSLSLRPVTLSNSSTTLPQVLQLIKDLATYEKEPDAVEATVDLLRESFFGGSGEGKEEEGGKGERYAKCVLAYQGESEEPVGMAVYL
jgi:hypothetical protein